MGSLGNIYTLEPSTGVATLKLALKAAAGDDNPFTALAGSNFGVDFNPAADRLRVVSDSDQSLRINVATGDTITDGNINLAGGAAVVTASAYTSAFSGTSLTELYALDAAAGTSFDQDPPNSGTLVNPVPLGATGAAVNGFDIDARTNVGYAAFAAGSTSSLYSIDIAAAPGTPGATVVGVIAGGEAIMGLALAATAAPSAIGLTADNRLGAFDPKAPNALTATTAITGLGAGETVVGIDARPSDGLLYALSSAGKVYSVDAASGAATLKSTLAIDPADATAPTFTALAGSAFSVDFNPVVDRLRIVSDSGQNLRVNVDTGLVMADTDLARVSAPASVLASAYANNFVGATATMLLNLEQNTDALTLQAPPNDGTLADVGPLGVDISGSAAFDIGGGGNGLALAALRSAATGPHSLYAVSLVTGAATPYRALDAAAAQIGGASGPALIDLAIKF